MMKNEKKKKKRKMERIHFFYFFLGHKYAGKEKKNYSVLKMDLWGHIHSQLVTAKPAKL